MAATADFPTEEEGMVLKKSAVELERRLYELNAELRKIVLYTQGLSLIHARADLPTEGEIDQMKLGKVTRYLREEFGMTEDETDEMAVEEAMAELKKRISDIQATAATRRRPGLASENLWEMMDKHNFKRQRLAELCQHIGAYLPKLDMTTKATLKTQFDRPVEDILADVQTLLHKEERPILVAGETSSGKSTFLNLLLGEDILPVAHLSSTSTICEVKYGETRQAVVHLHKSAWDRFLGQKTVTIPLDGTEEHQAELKSYMHLEGASRDSLPPAERVEIFWPLPFLKGGLVIVDSSGVGESKMMDKVVADYIPKAFAFLYIIDSSRAGGVQQDRLGQLLKLYAAKENAEDFDPESAMFICNKWDTVPAGEQDKLRSETFRKLSQMWPGLKEEQVFFVSMKKAVGPFGILSEDFTKVLDGLDLLLPKGLDIKLETQYRLLTQILSAALTHIDSWRNIALQNLDRGAKEKMYKEAQQHLQSYREEANKSMEALESMMSSKIEPTRNILYDLVESGQLKKDILKTVWLQLFIKMWYSYTLAKLRNEKKESNGENFTKLKDLYEALACDLNHCPSLEDHITSMELCFQETMKEVIESLENAHRHTMYVCRCGMLCKMKIGNVLSHKPSFFERLAFWKGLSPSLSNRLTMWGQNSAKVALESQSRTESILHNCWRRAPAGTPLIDILMQALKSEEVITELAERQIQPQRDLMALLVEDIAKMETIMEQTIDQTFKDIKRNEEILQTLEPQSRCIYSLLGQLAMFHLTDMRKYEYDLDSITGWRDIRNRLGGGFFGEVFRVQVPWKGAEIPAALKIGLMPYDIITTETAWDFLKKEDNLRKLKGEHIVKYYGTACRREEGGLRLGLVMELCEGTLEDRIIGNRSHNPAWWGADPEKQAAAFIYTQNLAVQLCEGLKHIHGEGYIHRDLKLRNILVIKHNIVKLADVGLTKREEKITGSIAGTPLYTAPEVKEQKMYDKSADIYSLGLILWEMWYGRTLFGFEDDMYFKQVEEYLREGRDIQMPRWEGTDPPIPEWTSLIHDCLKKDPKERPKIQECLDRISDMKVLDPVLIGSFHGQPEGWTDWNGTMVTLTVEHLQCFKDSKTVNFHPKTTAIVGPNSSGKTTLIRAWLLLSTLFYEVSSRSSGTQNKPRSEGDHLLQFISNSVITGIFALSDIRDFWHRRNTKKPVKISGEDTDGNMLQFIINYVMGGTVVRVEKITNGKSQRLAEHSHRPVLAVLDIVNSDTYKPQVPVKVPVPSYGVIRLDHTKVFSMLCELQQDKAYWDLLKAMLESVQPGCAIRLISGVRRIREKVIMVRERSVDIPLQTCDSGLLQVVAVLAFALHSLKSFSQPFSLDSENRPFATVLLDDIGSFLGSDIFGNLSNCLTNTINCQTVISTLWDEVARGCEEVIYIQGLSSSVGDHKKAITNHEQSLQMKRRIYGEHIAHADIARSLNNLGTAWSHLGDHRKAIRYHEQALQMRQSIYGEDTPHPDIAESLNSLGAALSNLGDYGKAVSFYEQSLKMRRNIYGEDTAPVT